VLGGALIGRGDVVHRLHEHSLRYLTGGAMSPLTAASILRGLKALSIRMERHSASALALAERLAAHPEVAWVSYPYLPAHPGHAIAKRQMAGGSGMTAADLIGDVEQALV
jgi:methionine-gamma-lyase